MTAPQLPSELPLLALRSTIVFPHGTIAVQMGAPENLALLRAHPEPGALVLVAVALGDDAQDPARLEGRVGVFARVKDRSTSGAETIQITLEGLARVRIGALSRRTPFPVARVEPVEEVAAPRDAARTLIDRIVVRAEALVERNEQFPAEVPGLLRRVAADVSRFTDLAASHGNLRIAERDEVLQRLD
ncbi:MAG TPA: LON peptidase substrate-binding domain-containing protein, partial [Gemmatimonadaceae bacterium]